MKASFLNYKKALFQRISSMESYRPLTPSRRALFAFILLAAFLVILPMHLKTEAVVPASSVNTVNSREQTDPGNITLCSPLPSSKVVSRYGPAMHPIKKREYQHQGVDLSGKRGTPVLAAAEGQVILVNDSDLLKNGYGYHVVIQHTDNLKTLYAHMDTVFVESGQKVEQGIRIGTVGSTGQSTGPHLHFEVRLHDEPVNPEHFLTF